MSYIRQAIKPVKSVTLGGRAQLTDADYVATF